MTETHDRLAGRSGAITGVTINVASRPTERTRGVYPGRRHRSNWEDKVLFVDRYLQPGPVCASVIMVDDYATAAI